MVIHVDRKPFGKAAFTPYPFVYVVWRGVEDWHPDDRACLMVHERAHTLQYLALGVITLTTTTVLSAIGVLGPLGLVLAIVGGLPVPFWLAWAIGPIRSRLEAWAHNRHVRCLKKRGRD